jgi:hypothetical protein
MAAMDRRLDSTFAHDALPSRFGWSPAAERALAEAPDEPQAQRAAWAVAVAPVLVLLALTLVIGDLIAPHLGLAGVLVSVAWLVFEMHAWQRALARAEESAAGHDLLS